MSDTRKPPLAAPEQAGGATDADHLKPADAAATSKTRRKTRWGRRLLIGVGALVVLLAVIVALVPTLLSTSFARNQIVGLANDALRGEIGVGSLSAGWGGPIELRGVRIRDEQKREVLAVDAVTLSQGVFALASAFVAGGTIDLGTLTIDRPRATLYISDANEVSLAGALSPRPSARETGTPSEPLPQLRGRLALRDGEVRALRADGRSYEVSGIETNVALESLDAIAADARLTLGDGATIATTIDLKQLITRGQVRLADVNGRVKLDTEGAIDLGRLAAFLGSDVGLAGKLSMKIDSNFQGPEGAADFTIDLAQLRTTRTSTAAAPLDVKLHGRAARHAGAIEAQAKLESAAGGLTIDATHTPSDAPLALDVDRLLAALLTGESLTLPEFTLKADGAVDLAELQKSVPDLLALREGQRITAGRVEIKNLSAAGGHEPAVSGTVEVRGITAVADGRTAQLQPITLGFDAAVQAGKGLEIRRAALESTFANVTAQGAASEIQAQFTADLAKLQTEIGQLVDLGGHELAGAVTGGLRVTRADENAVNVTLDAGADHVHYATADRRFDVQKLGVQHAGTLTLAEQKATRFDIRRLELDADGQIVASTTGWVDLAKEAFEAVAEVRRADLDFVAQRSAALGVAELSRYGGALAAEARIGCAGAGQPITTTGWMTGQALAADGQPLLEGESKLTWTGVEVTPDGAHVAAESVQFASAAAHVDATGVRLATGDTVDLRADVKADADLARVLRAVGVVARIEPPPQIAGAFAFRGKLATSGSQVSASGGGGVDHLSIGAGETTVREPRVDFEFDAKLDPPQERLALERFKLTSKPFAAELSGTIEQYAGPANLALRGRYDAGWEELTALLHELAPATKGSLVVKGRSSSEFEIRGPAHQPDVQPTFRGLATAVHVGWESATIYGVPLGAAKLAPALRDGQLTLPPASIAAAQGRVNLGGVVDFQPRDATLRMPGKLVLLDGVTITPELGASLLSRINPIFMHLARVEGRVFLNTTDVTLPFGEAAKTASQGAGALDLSDLKVQPGGVLGELLALAGYSSGETYEVKAGKLDFVIRDGRVVYDHFVMTFPQDFDLKFYGSVGFDDTLDLVVSVPLREAMLAKLGLKGPALALTQNLTGLRIDIPLSGTRQQPKLDLAKVDTEKLLKQMLVPKEPEKAIEKGIEDVLKGLGGGKPAPKPAEPRRPPPRDEPRRPRRP